MTSTCQGTKGGDGEGPQAVRSWNPREKRPQGAGRAEPPGLGAGVRICHVVLMKEVCYGSIQRIDEKSRMWIHRNTPTS